MAEELVTCDKENCCGGLPPEGIKPSDAAKTLKEKVEAQLAGSGPEVFQRVQTCLVNRELEDRTNIIIKAIAKKSELEKEIRKFKPDQTGVDGNGKVVNESYSKARFDELKKIKDQLQKIEQGLEEGLHKEKPCFKKLHECVGK